MEENVIKDQDPGQVPVTPDGGSEGVQNQAPVAEPFWKRIDPAIESEEKAAEVFASYRDKAAELEQRLASIDTTPRYHSTFTKRLDELVMQEVNNGADETTAISRARDYLNAQSRDYEAEAASNPEAILLEKYRKENPGLSDDKLRRVINSEYGLSSLRKPGEDASEEEIAAYNDAVELGRTRMEINARQYGREMNQKKETLGLSPEVKAYRQGLEQQQKALAEFMPRAMTAFSRHASSLKATIDGIEIDLSEYVAPGGRVTQQFEAAVKGWSPDVYSKDGVIDDDAVRDITLRVALYQHPEKVLSKAIKMGMDRAAQVVTDKKLNLTPPGNSQPPAQDSGDWRESLKRQAQKQGNLTQ